LIVLYALIGLVVGGMINILADVLPRRRAKLNGPICPACGQSRPPVQALATVAFLIGKRDCPSCGRPIALRNVIVELGMAILFALVYSRFTATDLPGLAVSALVSFHTAVLVLVTITDVEHRLILNRVTFPAMVIAALTSPIRFGPGWYFAFVGAAIGFIFFKLAVIVGNRTIGRGAMSEGDVTLAAYVGLITGFPGMIVALVIAILAGGLISFLLLLTRVVNLRSGIPYGPFIAIGGFVTMLWGQQLVTRFFWGG
jgi:prepilin signal peptidase PulO-like enzyme (type II secretory pathway)